MCRCVQVCAGQRSPCVHVSPAGIRKKERLVRREEEEQQEDEEEQSRRSTMDVSLLRQQYRSSRDTQRRHTQVLLLRTGETRQVRQVRQVRQDR